MVYIAMCAGGMFLAGSSVVVGKMLVDSVPVFVVTFGSLLVAFLCMLPLMYGRFQEVLQLDLRQWAYLFLQGVCGIVLFRVFTLYGLQSTSAVQAGIITGTTPAVLSLLSYALLGESLTLRSILGVICASGGAILILLYSLHAHGHGSLLGGLFVGAAVVCEALFTIFRKRIADTVSAVTNTTILIFCSLVLVAPFALRDLCNQDIPVNSASVLAILYYGVFATVIAYLLWTGAVGKVSGAAAGAATAVMPASSVLLAGAVLGEKILLPHVVGSLCIVAGILISATRNVGAVRTTRAADRRSR